MLHFKKEISLKRKLKYAFFIVAVFWFLINIYVVYQYLLHTSKEVVVKWWTFVEGIFDITSFLPYLRSDEQSLFYQGRLFQSCLKKENIDGNIVFNDEICHVTSADYKTYYISLLSWHIWSDGVPLSLEDVFFTYNDLLKHNIWGIPSLNKYEKIEVSQTDDGKVKIIFPEASTDNNLFFTNYILPRHALFDSKLDWYQKKFSVEPVYTNCAHIMPQSTDQYSLIFDLGDCKESFIGFYQIKNAISFDDFKNIVHLNGSIVDAYVWSTQASGYSKINLTTNKIAMIFFNTNSKKTRVRLRRALWWFINTNFFTGEYWEYIKKYDKPIFNNFLSTGGNIDDFLQRSTSDETLTKWDLQDIWVSKLPNTISLSGENKKIVHFVENISSRFTMVLEFDKKYNKISIVHNDGAEYSPKSYVASTKKWKYNIWPSLWNLIPGINKYKIFGYLKNKKILVATIDLYNLKWNISKNAISTGTIEENINIVYYKTPITKFIASQLQDIFAKNNILEFFSFIWFDNLDEFDGKIINGDYDIVINTVNMWLKQDISEILVSDNPKINHSQYINSRLVSLLKQYAWAKDEKKVWLIGQINNIYGTDMPFIMIWNEYSPLFIKPDILDKLKIDTQLSEDWRRDEIYKNLRLTESINIDFKNAWNLREFLKFIFDVL